MSIEELRALLEEGTELPWYADSSYNPVDGKTCPAVYHDPQPNHIVEVIEDGIPVSHADAALIAAAVNMLPALLAVAEAAEAMVVRPLLFAHEVGTLTDRVERLETALAALDGGA